MRAIILDRDGVICENRSDHVKSWEEFQFLPGVKESLAALRQLDLPIIVVTNQAIINRGMVSAEVVEDIHQRMVAEVAACGGRIDRVIYCPHRPDEKCNCRKPEPGMLWQVAREMGLELSKSYLVGDAATDLIAGDRVGCRTFLVLTGRGVSQLLPALRSVKNQFTITRSLVGATTHILKAELAITDEGDYTPQYHQIFSTANAFRE
jgi:D-glycero-D-manno-heptose 1,7-bisphosphate phosphatase